MKYLQMMVRDVKFIFVKDLRRGLLLCFAAAAYLIVFSWLYMEGVVTQIPLLVVDQDQSAVSRELIKDLSQADGLKLEDVAVDPGAAEVWLRQGRHRMAILLPEDYSTKIRKGLQTEIVLMVEGSNIIINSNAMEAALDVVRNYIHENAQRTFEENNLQLPSEAWRRSEPVQFNYRVLHNPNLDYLLFFVTGLSLVALQQGLLLATAASLIYVKQPATEDERKLNPILRWLAKSSVYVGIGLLAYLLDVVLMKYCFKVPLKGSSAEYALLGFCFIFCVANVAGVLACLTGDEMLFSRISIFYTVPAFMLSGFTWPLEGMPTFVQDIAWCSPFTYMANTFRELCLNGYSNQLQYDCLVLTAVGVVSFFLTAWLWQRRLQKQDQAPAALETAA
jgi:ABC-2 type transport system permease protein